ncbi:hypothetical protein Tco_0024657 [Tanacetum coccineum]
MPSWTSSESRVISGRVEYFCKYDDLPSEYYKYVMFQNQKQSKKHMDYEQVINVLAREKSMCEEELRATKSKLKLYDSSGKSSSSGNLGSGRDTLTVGKISSSGNHITSSGNALAFYSQQSSPKLDTSSVCQVSRIK